MGGHAKDYVRGMWMMLQQPEPEDFVLATGEQFSVRHLCELSFKMAGHPIEWRGNGIHEEGVDTTTGKVVISVSEKYYRPTEVETLLGDPTKALRKMNWKPEIHFDELIYDMLNHDFLLYGLELPKAAIEMIPGGPTTKDFIYPDLMLHDGLNSNSMGFIHPEVGCGSPTASCVAKRQM